jgi:hypothetical protein
MLAQSRDGTKANPIKTGFRSKRLSDQIPSPTKPPYQEDPTPNRLSRLLGSYNIVIYRLTPAQTNAVYD